MNAKRGWAGSIFAVLLVASFWVGCALRVCRPFDFEALYWAVLFPLVVGFVVTVPALIAGMLLGYLTRFKMGLIPALVSAMLLIAVTVGIGYAVPTTSCGPTI